MPLPGQSQDLNEYSWRQSLGCITGPFTTGILANGSKSLVPLTQDNLLQSADTGAAFSVAQLEANPEGFFADTHTVEFAAGAIRGQLQYY